MNYFLNRQFIQSATYDPESLSDTDLLKRCQQLGSISVKSRRMFVGLLPLIARRNIYDAKKFSSIFHFALIVGGVSYDVVSEVLRLDAQLIDLSNLRRALYRGEIGWSKIRAVLSLVTSNNEVQWLELLASLSKPALEVYVRNYRQQQKDERHSLFSKLNNLSCQQINNISLSSPSQKNVPNKAQDFPGEITHLENSNDIGQISKSVINIDMKNKLTSKLQQLSSKREILSFPVNRLLAAQLRLFRQKLEKRLKKLTTWEDVLNELLEKYE